MTLDWTDIAILDLENIKEYISRDSIFYANRFVEKIISAVEPLKKFPRMGRIVPEAEDENIRELIVRNYRIMYRIEIQRVLILTIIHGARDLNLMENSPWEIN